MTREGLISNLVGRQVFDDRDWVSVSSLQLMGLMQNDFDCRSQTCSEQAFRRMVPIPQIAHFSFDHYDNLAYTGDRLRVATRSHSLTKRTLLNSIMW